MRQDSLHRHLYRADSWRILCKDRPFYYPYLGKESYNRVLKARALVFGKLGQADGSSAAISCIVLLNIYEFFIQTSINAISSEARSRYSVLNGVGGKGKTNVSKQLIVLDATDIFGLFG